MPLTIQHGELADRIRAFFRITGRIPSQFDENIVGAAIVEDVSKPPYRPLGGVADFGSQPISPATAAEQNGAGIYVPAALKVGAAVVDNIVFVNSSAGTLSYALVIGFADLGATSFPGFADSGNPAPNLDDERSPGATAIQFLPVREFTAHSAALFGAEICRVTLPGPGSFSLPWRITLRPGFGAATYCTTLATAHLSNWHGTWYPDIP